MKNDIYPKKVAVIPARGGSKRIPRKNIKNFLGKPAISYALESAIVSGLFDQIVVTTDDLEIAEISSEYGASLIIHRPRELADDITPTVPVIGHACIEIQKIMNYPEEFAVCCIYPINPFIEVKDIQTGFDFLCKHPEVSYVNSICTYPYPIQRALSKNKEGKISMLHPDLALTRSQDLEETFHDAGQWYWGSSSSWILGKKLLFNSIGVNIPRWRCQDIDTEEDWDYAERLFKVSNRLNEGN